MANSNPKPRRKNPFEKACFSIVKVISNPWSIILHTVWFALWFIIGLELELLITIVSLEAIYLCIFILVSSNKELEYDRRRMMEDYRIDRHTKEEMLKLSKAVERAKRDIREIKKKLEVE